MPKPTKKLNTRPPSKTVENGAKVRGKNGQFLPGNKIATKNKGIGHKVTRFRNALFDNVTMGEFLSVTQKVIELAQDGSPWATRLFFEYILGKPTEHDFNERLELIESRLKGGNDESE